MYQFLTSATERKLKISEVMLQLEMRSSGLTRGRFVSKSLAITLFNLKKEP